MIIKISCDVSLNNFHEIDTNSRKFHPENFLDSGFYTKFFYHENLEPNSNIFTS